MRTWTFHLFEQKKTKNIVISNKQRILLQEIVDIIHKTKYDIPILNNSDWVVTGKAGKTKLYISLEGFCIVWSFFWGIGEYENT